MKKLLIFIFFFSFLWAQKESHRRSGELLVQIQPGQEKNVVAALKNEIGNSFAYKWVSKPLNILEIFFDEAVVSYEVLKRKAFNLSYVTNVQGNYNLQFRATEPNDAGFGNQWWHKNNGGNGGTVDADIDSELAWDITTGGTTSLGDEIVVCILEGTDWSHSDLAANRWQNSGEIDGNGIDDDGNGYIDDIYGWDISTNNDNIPAESHGTQVAGMIGAVGNNGSGASGVNWNVKMMNVSGFNLNDADVIEAYTYPLETRRLYNTSGGTKGAFIVATNASWGLDAEDPSNHPLWCAMYDSLGKVGILNCGSTTNSALNVDTQGDMPTACASDYMISVTATDNRDVRTFSGYGQTTIDIAAPGEDVYTTSIGGGYGYTSGTSFAGPLTAGVIALMYSAPCADIASMASNDPKAAADLIRQYLFQGVDPKANLTTETVTGGRVNAYNSLQLILNNCSGGCTNPYSLNTVSNGLDYTFSWSGNGATYYNVRYRIVGQAWTLINNVATTNYTITAQECSDYEWQVQAYCGPNVGDTSDYTAVQNFTSVGCCENPADLAVVTNDLTATFNWSEVFAANSYDIRYKLVSSGTWIDITGVASNTYTVNNLEPCENYEVQIQVNCTNSPGFSSSIQFTSGGCGSCVELNYCNAFGISTDDEWLQSFEINNVLNNSGNNGGYQLFEQLGIVLEQSGNYSFTLTPGYAGQAYDEDVVILIDYNQNGNFETEEIAYNHTGSITGPLTENISIPYNALLGSTRMRVMMKYSGWGGINSTCEEFDYGEVEDYCVQIVEASVSSGVLDIQNTALIPYPNPTKDMLYFNIQVENKQVEVLSLEGKLIEIGTIKEGKMDLTSIPKGIYIFKIEGNYYKIIKE